MNLSNFIELIQAKELNKSNLSKISGFSTRLTNLAYANAFFTDDEDKAKKAVIAGAYAIVTSANLKIIDEEVAYLKVDNLNNAISRLTKYIGVEKKAILVSSIDKECFFRLKIPVLTGCIKDDLEIIIKNDLLIYDDGDYFNSLGLSYELPRYSYELLKYTSFFYQDIKLNDEIFMNISLPKVFANSLAIAHSLKININYHNLKLLDYVFYNDENEQCKMNEASKVVFFEDCDLVIEEIRKLINLKEILELKNYNYMLYRGNKEEFLQKYKINNNRGLF